MSKLHPLQRGVFIFLLLGILTIIEYILGINEVPQILLWTIAIIKILLVLQYFMHIYKVFKSDDGGHE
jgi:hypothetical protein